ncbi:ig domain protein group 2 domain protein [Ruminococcus sp. CAG:382]|nr:ig domain protein group 2 domain protein [Ruminococcus sp. CAG:382]
MFNCVDANYVAGTAGITVNGGTFVGYDPRNNAAEGANTSFVASGVGVDKNTGGTFTAKPGMVAQIVDANGNSVAAYATLAEAIAAAAKNSTVKLIADTRENVTIDKALTLDLNGKKLSTSKNANDNTKHYYAIDNYGTFTLRDSSAAQTGEIRARGIENLGSGKMVIESGKIVAIDTNGGAAIWNLADLTIQGGTFVAEHVGASGDQYGPGCVYNNGKLTINGGTFKSANKRTYAIVSKSGAVTITPAEGKTVEISGAHGGLGIDGGTAIINGGSYASDDYYGLYVSNDFETAEVTVTGGTFDGKEYSAFIGSDGSNSVDSKLIIKGGTFNKPIHAQDNTSKGAIQVSSGTFSSAVPKDYCAEFFKPVQNADGKYTVEKVKTNNVKINFGGTGGSQITVGVDGSISIINNHTQEFATGELVSLTATAQDNAKFLFWLDSNRRIVSTNATYQFYVDSDISVTAQFYTPAEGKRYVIFIDMDNHVAGYADVAFGSTVTAPDHLTFANRTFDGWYVDGHTNKYDVGASITVTKGDKDPLYVHAKYTATDTLIKVYIDDKLYGEFAYGSDVTVTADESTSDGKFAGWYIGDALVSTKREYSFRVASEVRLTKKYDVSGIESKAIINMFVADRTEENTIIVYEIRWELPENCKFTSGGLLLTKFRENADKLTVENKGAEGITHRSITSTASGLYKCTVKLSDASSTIYAKAYINYIDADGKVQTIYTDLYTSVGK